MPDIYYKYRADSEYTEAIFTTGEVFLSTAAGLNDPFECSLQDIAETWIQEQVATMKQAGVAGFIMAAHRALKDQGNFFGCAPHEIESMLNEFETCNDIDAAYVMYVQFMKRLTGRAPSNCERFFTNIDAQLNAVGIFSMSAKPDHPLMWAHYAKDSGVCIGFSRVTGSKMADPTHFLPVRYSDALPKMDEAGLTTSMSFSVDENFRPYTSAFEVSFTDKTFQEAITTKPTVWQYEDEWRYVEPFAGTYEWPGVLSELVFGLKCPQDRRIHYIRLVEAYVPNEVRLFEIRRVHGTNSLERVALDPPTTTPKCTTRPTPLKVEDGAVMSAKQFADQMERMIQKRQIGPAIYAIGENLKTQPDSPLLLGLMGMAYGMDNNHEKALEYFTRLTKVTPDSGAAWYQLSVAYTQLSRPKEALNALRKAYAIDPNDPSIALNLGVHLLETQEIPDEGMTFLHRAERLGHRRARALITRVQKHLEKDRP